MCVCVCNVLQLSTSHYTTKKNRSANKIDMCSFNVYAVCIYIYIYMVIDLKVLARSFICESRACYVGNPRESFFSSSRK